MEVLRYIPGFRSKTKWKMAIAGLYYLLSLFSTANSFWSGVLLLSLPFVLFSLIDVIRNKRRSQPTSRALAVLLVSTAIMVTSAAAMPPPEQNASRDQNTTNLAQGDQLAQQEPETVTSSQGRNEAQEPVASPPAPQPQPAVAESGWTEEAPVPLVAVQVTKVVDGDTVEVRFGDSSQERVRLIGVDTPESTIQQEPYGKEASSFTRSTLLGRTVYLEKDVSERDKYGRLLRYVWLEKPNSIT